MTKITPENDKAYIPRCKNNNVFFVSIRDVNKPSFAQIETEMDRYGLIEKWYGYDYWERLTVTSSQMIEL